MANKRGRDASDDNREIERIRAEIEQEKQMSVMLDQSMLELTNTLMELERRYDGVMDEGNEWKTRFETQEELNALLEKQILVLKERLDKSKEDAKDGFDAQLKSYDELSESSLRRLVRELEREKNSLNSQLRDYDWRLDQESKAFHKAHEARKNYLTELRNARVQEEEYRQTQRGLKGSNFSTPRDSKNSTPGSREPGRNVPDNQRIIDPRRGPIRKTAAVKKLPKLDTP
ncbi:coiled-coil domain-containing protein 169-like [Diadema antillarum]|uniref:coiled-coil domain-containing protein 169-like n=1 Tax=Diadema antillarum TaxID=105358 RepID=UPI003A84BDDC